MSIGGVYIFTPIFLCIMSIYTYRQKKYNIAILGKSMGSRLFPRIGGERVEKQTKVSKAQQRAVNKYVKENYDRINVTFPKGQK